MGGPLNRWGASLLPKLNKGSCININQKGLVSHLRYRLVMRKVSRIAAPFFLKEGG